MTGSRKNNAQFYITPSSGIKNKFIIYNSNYIRPVFFCDNPDDGLFKPKHVEECNFKTVKR